MRFTALALRGALYGATVTMSLACGGGEKGPSEGRAPNESAAKITALGPASVDGCAFGLAFDIQAPAAIGVVGIAPLEGIVGAPTLSLFAVDGFGQEQLVSRQASSVTGSVASLLSSAFVSDGLMASDNVTSVASANQTGAVSTNDALRNGTSLTTHESGSFARDSYGDQALLADSLAAAGWEPISTTVAPLVASSLDGTESIAAVDRGVASGGFSTGESNSFGVTGSGSLDSAVLDATGWAAKSVDTGIGRLNVREAWGSDSVLASQQATNGFGSFGNATTASQGASSSVYTAEQSIQNAVAFSALDTLSSQHFVLRIDAVSMGGAAGLRVFQGTESLLFATEDASVVLPACGN